MAYTFKHGDRPLDGYTIQRAVGRGGFGEVYYALSDGGREVALKYLRENPDVELRGVSHCINLKSPHLVSIFDVKKTHDGEYIIIMEYCSGPSLRDLMIAEPNGFPTEKAAFFARETAKGLSYLHERGIVHRDLKPGNLFFDDGYVKIGDYGLSKFISVSRHSAQTASVGTVHYMAPEIGSGNYSRGVDIYALGVMLYEMLLGKVPFEGSSMAEVLMKHLTAQPELDQLPKPFAHVIRKALEKDPKDRYQTVDEMIEEMLSGEQIQKSLAGFSPKSLPGAVARGGQDPAASPYPSPNPLPSGMPTMPLPPRPPGQPGSGMPMPDRLAKKLDKVSRKIEKKMSKLAGKAGIDLPQSPQRPFAHVPSAAAGGGPVPWATPAPPASLNTKRFMLTSLLTVGLAVGLGFWVAIGTDLRNNEEMGYAAAMLVVAMRLALGLASKASSWFAVGDGPVWAQRMVAAGAAAPLLAAGTGPAFETEGGFPLFLALVASAAFADWRKLADENVGEIRFGPIFGKALGAFILTAITTSLFDVGQEESYLFIAAGVAAAAAFIVQAGASWGTWTPQHSPTTNKESGASTPPDRHARTVTEQDTPTWSNNPAMNAAQTASDAEYALKHPQSPFATGLRQSALANGLRLRGGFTRFFWALMAFALSGGAIATFVVNLAGDLSFDDRTGVVIGNIACFVGAVYAMTKATPFAKIGFWRGGLRPLMTTLFAFGVGASITGIARNWDHCQKWSEPGSSMRFQVIGDVESRVADAENRIDVANARGEVFVSEHGHDTPIVLPEPDARHFARVDGMELGQFIEQSTAVSANAGHRECVRYTLGDDERGGLVVVLVLCSIAFLALLYPRGFKPKSPQEFLQGSAT